MPKVHVTVKHGIPNQKQDAMCVWIENVTRSQLKVCLRESRTFDGPHSNIGLVRDTFLLFHTLDKFFYCAIHSYISDQLNTIFNCYERTNNVFITE